MLTATFTFQNTSIQAKENKNSRQKDSYSLMLNLKVECFCQVLNKTIELALIWDKLLQTSNNI